MQTTLLEYVCRLEGDPKGACIVTSAPLKGLAMKYPLPGPVNLILGEEDQSEWLGRLFNAQKDNIMNNLPSKDV